MAANASDKLPVGSAVVVADGVRSPDFPDISFAGWTGKVVELSGKRTEPRYILEWSAATLAGMPREYRDRCEQQGLLYSMACLEREQLELRDAQ
ncbi:MAG: hypothetical protein WD069_19135 [Planctomycetales bacterium]